MQDKTRIERWTSADSYKTVWGARGEALIGLFDAVGREEGRRYRLAELGCGAHAPIFAACRDRAEYEVVKHDIVAWDDETRVVNFNTGGRLAERFDIAVFSGVLEYLTDVEATLRHATEMCDFVLFSYGYLSREAVGDDALFLKEIGSRARDQGWRNHYTLRDITALATRVGVISNVGRWRKQALMLLRSFDHDALG